MGCTCASQQCNHLYDGSTDYVFLLAATTKEFGKVRGRCRDDAVAVVMHRRGGEWREH